jgi:hypothetical protein
MKAVRNHSRGRLAYPLVFAVSLLGLALPQAAFAEESKYVVCPQEAGHYSCASLATPPGTHREISPNLEGSGELKGLAPKDLREAYKLPETGGAGQTVAIVDAFNDPNAESDLKVYREHYGLSKCTEENGCFKKVNQKGETKNYPEGNIGWSLEMSLDLDMVSAICQECHIVLVEAETNSFQNMHEDETEAASLKGVTEISNSWGASERSEETSEESYFNHPGIPTTFSAGDYGYGVEYPAASPHVIAVGGTTLKKAESSRGWTETVWSGTGSGCSHYTEKPTWQADKGCTHRTNNDVAADASGESPVSVYDSYGYPGWENVWGTSAASPIISGVEAHASEHTRALGAEAFYKDTSALFDVTSGSNGTCTEEYLCHGEVGYDGPTGLGTPDGIPHVIGWSVEPTPLESGATESTLTGESCVSSTFCMSSTNYTTSERPHATYISEWNGSEWVLQALPGPESSKEWWINGVSCTSTTACTAVGKYTTTAGIRKTLAERWNGTKWSVQSTPNPSGTSEAVFRGVSCSSSTACVAVGSYYGSGGSVLTLAEQWNGTEWKIQSTPNAPELSFTLFTGVSCASSTACMAVGFAQSGSTDYAWIERWNGTEWASQKIGSPSGARAGLFWSVSCTSSSACTAVGSYTNSSGTKVDLVNRWNGTEWLVQAMPNEPTGSIESALTGVSCSSSSSCMAVANNSSATRAHGAYAMKWNGTEWAFQALPEPSEATASWMYGVSCVSSTECTAGGAITNGSGMTVTLADGYF